MSKSIYPRQCPTCGVTIKDRSNFARHRKFCGKKIDRVPCPHCEVTFTRKDVMKKHVRKFHSEAAKRKADETQELQRLEILHGGKVSRLVDEDSQVGGAVETRGSKRSSDEDPVDPKWVRWLQVVVCVLITQFLL